MKFSKKNIITFLIFTFFGYSGVFAAGLDNFRVTLDPESAKIGEAFDLTIEAVDKNGELVKNYNGTILIFSESDPEVELPIALEENAYTFSESDQGLIRFENSIKFKKGGTQSISIYDLDDSDVFGLAEVEIKKDIIESNIDISILSPEDGLTIGKKSINISGSTRKNYQVQIIINENITEKTTSDGNGFFELQINDLIEGENKLKAQLLNSDDKIIGASDEILINVTQDNLNIKNIKVSPEKIESESSFEIELIANTGLTIDVIIDDVVTSLTESDDGKYSTKLYAPQKSGTYSIDVKLKSELGNEKKELGASSIVVIDKKLNSATVPKDIIPIKNPIIAPTQNNTTDLQITGLKLVELKSKSILTWDKIEGIESYNVYKKTSSGTLELIENVVGSKFEIELSGENIIYDYFAVKAVAKTASGEIYEGSLSDATKIKTGPEMIILILISLFIGGIMIVTRKKA